jgi:hypothetical protein
VDEKKKISGPLNCLRLEKLEERDLEKHRLRPRQAGESFAKLGNRRIQEASQQPGGDSAKAGSANRKMSNRIH